MGGWPADAEDRLRTRRFYDELAATYDLIYADWDASVSRQGRALHQLLELIGVRPEGSVLDCACGIGTQSLGLALLGWQLTGTDISVPAVRRARSEAETRGLRL